VGRGVKAREGDDQNDGQLHVDGGIPDSRKINDKADSEMTMKGSEILRG